MEKLDLQKFEDYALVEKQLSFIHAGECDTEGGTELEIDDIKISHYRYDSDYINSSGATFYNNYTYVPSIDLYFERDN